MLESDDRVHHARLSLFLGRFFRIFGSVDGLISIQMPVSSHSDPDLHLGTRSSYEYGHGNPNLAPAPAPTLSQPPSNSPTSGLTSAAPG
jgi:hypothetical protein